MLLQLCPDVGPVQLFTPLPCRGQSLTLPGQGFRRKDDLRTSLGAHSGGVQEQAPGMVPARRQRRSHSELLGGGNTSEDSSQLHFRFSQPAHRRPEARKAAVADTHSAWLPTAMGVPSCRHWSSHLHQRVFLRMLSLLTRASARDPHKEMAPQHP